MPVIKRLIFALICKKIHISALINKQQKVIVRTPATSDEQEEHIATLLENVNYVSLLQILTAVDKTANFTKAFEQFSVKHSKGKPSLETLFAGLVAQGYNIGVEKLAHTPKGYIRKHLKKHRKVGGISL